MTLANLYNHQESLHTEFHNRSSNNACGTRKHSFHASNRALGVGTERPAWVEGTFEAINYTPCVILALPNLPTCMHSRCYITYLPRGYIATKEFVPLNDEENEHGHWTCWTAVDGYYACQGRDCVNKEHTHPSSEALMLTKHT